MTFRSPARRSRLARGGGKISFKIILGFSALFFRDYFLPTVMVPRLSADNLLAVAQQAAPFPATLEMGRNDNAGVECRLMISRTHV